MFIIFLNQFLSSHFSFECLTFCHAGRIICFYKVLGWLTVDIRTMTNSWLYLFTFDLWVVLSEISITSFFSHKNDKIDIKIIIQGHHIWYYNFGRILRKADKIKVMQPKDLTCKSFPYMQTNHEESLRVCLFLFRFFTFFDLSLFYTAIIQRSTFRILIWKVF